MSLLQKNRNFSRSVLVRVAIAAALVAVVLGLNLDFIVDVYLRGQLTTAGWILNGGILTLFLLGMGRIIAVLRRYMQEEAALTRFVRALEAEAPHPDAGIDGNSMIVRRFEAVLTLSRENAPVNHSALASVQVARESTAISLPKFINNILILTGVFGTIVSLSIALLGASSLLGAPQEGSESMGLVIHGMSTALSTTITAIVCYLVYGYFYLKLTDVQTHLLGELEQTTSLYLLPRYAHSPDNLAQRVSGLVQGLSEVAEVMRAVQADTMEAAAQLHSLISALNQRTKPMADDLQQIKRLLREGFRLPESGAP